MKTYEKIEANIYIHPSAIYLHGKSFSCLRNRRLHSRFWCRKD